MLMLFITLLVASSHLYVEVHGIQIFSRELQKPSRARLTVHSNTFYFILTVQVHDRILEAVVEIMIGHSLGRPGASTWKPSGPPRMKMKAQQSQVFSP